MTNVVQLPATETLTIEQALSLSLKEAQAGDFTEVLVIATNASGQLTVRSSRMSDRDALWLLKKAELYALGLTELV